MTTNKTTPLLIKKALILAKVTLLAWLSQIRPLPQKKRRFNSRTEKKSLVKSTKKGYSSGRVGDRL